jgi:hypothetical protein
VSNLEYYRQQSVYTDPGPHARLYDALPSSIGEICQIARDLIVHYAALGPNPPADRIGEIDCRYLRAMLDRILELDERPLTESRVMENRLVGCCRDHSVLMVSILRHKGVPARARYGASAYIERGYFCDHVIVEYWNGARWVGVDSELGPYEIDMWKVEFDPFDVPANQFIRGGAGWLMCRAGQADPERFGLGSASALCGWEFVIGETLLDLAALNGCEMLCWDSWGMSERAQNLTECDKTFLDDVARATLDDGRADDWARLFADDRLRIPPLIRSYSPAVKPEDMPLEVVLDLAAG